MQQQSFVGHSDSVTGLAWADDQTLISTGAGDAVIIWHRTSAPLPSTPDPTATHPHATPTPTLGRETHAEAVLQGQPIHNTLVAWNEPATTATDLGQSPQPLASPCNVGAVSAVTYSLPVQQVAASAAAMPPGVDVQQTAASIVGTSSQDRLQQHAACLTMTNAVQLDTGPMSLAVAEQAMGASATACSTAVALAHSPLSHSWHQCQSVGGSPAVNSLRGLTIERVVGFNGAAPGGCVWLESSAQLVYAAGRMLLIEDLATRQQRYQSSYDIWGSLCVSVCVHAHLGLCRLLGRLLNGAREPVV